MPKQIKCILDWKNNQRACTSQYGQALRKRMDPLEGFLFTNPENKFPVIFEVCATDAPKSYVIILAAQSYKSPNGPCFYTKKIPLQRHAVLCLILFGMKGRESDLLTHVLHLYII